MRPVALRIQAFGSFAEVEHVRFDTLAELGLFVVSGPTGSGKSTIFDAMSVALFGKVPGDRPPDVRSHHARSGRSTPRWSSSSRWNGRAGRCGASRRRSVSACEAPACASCPRKRSCTSGSTEPGRASSASTAASPSGASRSSGSTSSSSSVSSCSRRASSPSSSCRTPRSARTCSASCSGRRCTCSATEWYQEHARRLHADVAEIEQIIEHHRTERARRRPRGPAADPARAGRDAVLPRSRRAARRCRGRRDRCRARRRASRSSAVGSMSTTSWSSVGRARPLGKRPLATRRRSPVRPCRRAPTRASRADRAGGRDRRGGGTHRSERAPSSRSSWRTPAAPRRTASPPALATRKPQRG